MNIFDAAMRAGDTAVDSVMGEAFRFWPMRAGVDMGPTQDPERAQLDLIAPWAAPPRQLGDATRLTRSTFQPRIMVMKDKLPQGVRQGDRFRRELDGTFWEVLDVQPDSLDMRLSLPVRLIVS